MTRACPTGTPPPLSRPSWSFLPSQLESSIPQNPSLSHFTSCLSCLYKCLHVHRHAHRHTRRHTHTGNISACFGNLGCPGPCDSTRKVPFWVLGLKRPTGGCFGLLLPRHPPSPRPRVAPASNLTHQGSKHQIWCFRPARAHYRTVIQCAEMARCQ